MYHLFNIIMLAVGLAHIITDMYFNLKHKPSYGNKYYVYFQKYMLWHTCMLGTLIFTNYLYTN